LLHPRLYAVARYRGLELRIQQQMNDCRPRSTCCAKTLVDRFFDAATWAGKRVMSRVGPGG
jgi:hypothetical protein